MNQYTMDFEENNRLPESVKLQVDGRLIDELSKQVSSHLFAIGELMKNSYDAKATKIDITFDMKNNKLIIEDDGDGIRIENLRSLLRIAKSEKEYGKKYSFKHHDKNIERYTQGSKGLGLFCAFKFGNIVRWDTKFKEHSYAIVVNKEDIINSSDISLLNFPVLQGSRKKVGTTITIEFDTKDHEFDYIYKTMSNSINYKKLVNFFYDNSMTVKFKLIQPNNSENIEIQTLPKEDLNNLFSEHKIFDINYKSTDNILRYHDFNNKEHKNSFIKKYVTEDYIILLEINAYMFPNGFSVSKNFDNIFQNSNKELSPLVYINGVLFNNNNIFNPSITRKIQSSKSMPQLTGFIQIYCTHTGLQFNNERTELIANTFNDILKSDLTELNKFLQEQGRKIYKKLEPKTPAENNGTSEPTTNTGSKATSEPTINTGTTAASKPTTNTGSKATSEPTTNTGSKATSEPTTNTGSTVASEPTTNTGSKTTTELSGIQVPVITLVKNEDTIKFDDKSEIIDLFKYIKAARNCINENISNSKIKISINNKIAASNFLESQQSSTTIKITYSFIDDKSVNTIGDPLEAIAVLNLNFIKTEFTFDKFNTESKLIKPIGFKDYVIKLDGVAKLIQQINELYVNHNNYDMCLAASIRVVFDLTTYRYQQLHPNETFSSRLLEVQVNQIIKNIKSNNQHFTKVIKELDVRHLLNDNLFDPELFSSKVKVSNLGSHTGSSHLGIDTINDIAMHAGYYAQLVDAHCKVKGLIA